MSDHYQPQPRTNHVVEMGLARMRVGVGRTAAEVYRPRICLFVDHASGLILHFQLAEAQPEYVPFVIKTLGELADHIGGLPAEIYLRDPKLAGELQKILRPDGVRVAVRESLPALDRAAESLVEMQSKGAPKEPGLLDVEGMTLDHVTAFAEAAKLFYEAKPWRQLTDEDPILIDAPAGPPRTKVAMVLGAGGQAFGLGFAASMEAYEKFRQTGAPRGTGVWSVTFGDIDRIPFEDGEMWERHHLPLAGPQAYPAFVQFFKKSFQHPLPQELAWAEGLLRAIVATTEQEIDQGRWEKTVQTAAGPATYRLSLPLLLDAMAGHAHLDPAGETLAAQRRMEAVLRAAAHKAAASGLTSPEDLKKIVQSMDLSHLQLKPASDAERAQAVADLATQFHGRRQIQLIRQALQIDRDCVDALLLLADRESDPEAALELFRKAVEAGERKVGPDALHSLADFQTLVESRPYLRARQRLAATLLDLGRYDEAVTHFQDMLLLDPADSQSNRYMLAEALLALDRVDELDTLLNTGQYKSEVSAEWSYTRALTAFRKSGDSPQATRRLDEAISFNPHVLPYLAGDKELPPESPAQYDPGSEDEAILYVESAADYWSQTPGAIEWLQDIQDAADRRKAQQTDQ